MINKIKLLLLHLLVLSSIQPLLAQDDILFDEDFVSDVFNYGILINNQTTETTSKGSFQLRIQHRFGELDFKDFGNTVIREFLGFDGSANIRFGFTFAVTDNLQIGLGRTKIDKVYDFEAKYRFLRESKTKSPISLTLYLNTAISSLEFPEVAPNEFFADGKTPFEYRFAHRVAYNSQIIVSKKFGEQISLMASPTFIYKNLVPEGHKNFVFGATLGGRFKTGITSSIILEYTAKFNSRNKFKNPLALGYEIGTAGHAFQMFVISTNRIMPQNLYYSSPLDYSKGKLVIGFNIKRTFIKNNNE